MSVRARWCPECETWLATHEYTVNTVGETVCPECDVPTSATIPDGHVPPKTRILSLPEAAEEAAVRQGLARR